MAFDALAPTYDLDFTLSPIAKHLRQRVHTRLSHCFHTGDHILELGCGTGEDALFLASQGIHVTATDASDAMLAVAQAKAANQPHIRFATLDLRSLDGGAGLRPAPTLDSRFDETRYDGAYASFGVLNCLSDWRPLAAWLAARIKPGGVAAFGVMSPLCLWEMGWHGLHFNFGTAFRRLRNDTTFQASTKAEAIPIAYPTIRRLTRDFAPHFMRLHLQPLGLFLPPSDIYGVVEKRPRLLKTLLRLDNATASIPALASFADHYWIEFQRQSS